MLFPRRPPFCNHMWSSDTKSSKCVNLVSFPFMVWNPLSESAGNTILQNGKKSGDKELDLKNKKNEPGTLRNKTLKSGWRKASSLFPDSDDLHAQKSHVMKSTFWKKKRCGYDENSHKHYNAKVLLFTGFLELEESHLKSFRVQIYLHASWIY